MKNLYSAIACSLLLFCSLSSCIQNSQQTEQNLEEEHEGYDGPRERALLEIEKTKDPALGYVPIERLWTAMDYTENLKRENNYRTLSLLWTERGPPTIV